MSYRIIQKIYGGRGCIIMLHRVRDEPRLLKNNSGLDTSSADFATLIEQLLAWDYDIISLDDMMTRMRERKTQKRFAVLTFDDGYKDNLTKALPICERYQVPMTVYVTTCFPDNTIVLWWDWLEQLLAQENHLQMNWRNQTHTFQLDTIENKERAHQTLKQLILTTDAAQQPQLFEQLFLSRGLNNEAYCRQEVLTWDEVATLNKHPLVTIGAHTKNHLALAHLSAEEAWQEIIQGKNLLQEHLQSEIDHFAYPYGTALEVGAREMDLAKKAHFKTAVTTRHGHIFMAHTNWMQALPRIGLSSEKLSKLKSYLSGVNAMIRHKGKRVVNL
jgi:peptidoglycan/xylan/chitin deacetylase (PgdA/CDA1 family)